MCTGALSIHSGKSLVSHLFILFYLISIFEFYPIIMHKILFTCDFITFTFITFTFITFTLYIYRFHTFDMLELNKNYLKRKSEQKMK